jgi:glycosyltransferase involved in cell wall biosynthesis
MRLCLAMEEQFFETPDKKVWSAGPCTYSFLQRYLWAYEELQIIARVARTLEPMPGWKRCDGAGVRFAPVPFYVGPWEYACRMYSVNRAARQAFGSGDALVIRVVGQIASALGPMLRGGRPFGLEVVGDPYEVFGPRATRGLMRPAWRWWFTRLQRRACVRASATCYVTESYLQKRYPSSNSAFCTSFSNLQLNEESFSNMSRTFDPLPRPMRIITVGALAQPYKGVDVLLDAVTVCIQRDLNIELIVAGGGRYLPELQQQATVRGIAGRVLFLGEVPSGKDVRDQLDKAHIFVLASRTEGKPRAMIEAMARGLPCIGTDAGGIPELLPPDCIVPRGDATTLADKILEICGDPERLARMSVSNITRAREYHDSVLDTKRVEFLLHLRRRTEEWLRGRQIASAN